MTVEQATAVPDEPEIKASFEFFPPNSEAMEQTLWNSVERLQPIRSDTFSVTQSLAKGGLAAGWGAGVFPFSDEDLPGTPFRASGEGQRLSRLRRQRPGGTAAGPLHGEADLFPLQRNRSN